MSIDTARSGERKSPDRAVIVRDNIVLKILVIVVDKLHDIYPEFNGPIEY